MMTALIFKNAFMIDCTGNEPRESAWLVVQDGLIKETGTGKMPSLNKGTVVDCKGYTLMPGLIDAHIHVSLFDNDLGELGRRSYPTMHYVRALGVLKDTLDQGFTTVRDAGGADAGFRVAVESGLVPGPRITVCGQALTMTGGHADPRLSTEVREPFDAPFMGVVADGVAEVQRAAREQLRRGVNYLKVMAGGGCGSPADEPDTSQYSLEELKAIVGEADSAKKKVLAHCYSNSSMRLCADAGIYSLEHGNYLDEATAKYAKEKGCWLVPTLSTYFYMSEHGEELGIPEYFLRKMKMVREFALEAVHNAMKAGMDIGSGSDMVGAGQYHKNMELELKSRVMGPMGSILSATRENARLLQQEDRIGSLENGKYADIILIKGDPLKDMSIFQNRDNIKIILQRGNFYKNIM